MLLDLEAWLRGKNMSASDSLREAFEELVTVHRLQVPSLVPQDAAVNQSDREYGLAGPAQ
jgi:hypothetical protein